MWVEKLTRSKLSHYAYRRLLYNEQNPKPTNDPLCRRPDGCAACNAVDAAGQRRGAERAKRDHLHNSQ